MGNKQVKLSLSAKEIYDHQFKESLHGYDAFEVDSFLDKVISDYQKVEQNILIKQKEYDGLVEKIALLNKDKEKLEVANQSMTSKLGNISNNKNVNSGNIDLFKKIDQLERALWRLGVDPNKIK